MSRPEGRFARKTAADEVQLEAQMEALHRHEGNNVRQSPVAIADPDVPLAIPPVVDAPWWLINLGVKMGAYAYADQDEFGAADLRTLSGRLADAGNFTVLSDEYYDRSFGPIPGYATASGFSALDNNSRTLVISFRGTDSPGEIDLDASIALEIAAIGYSPLLASYASLFNELITQAKSHFSGQYDRILFTGHSFGGMVAEYFTNLHFASNVYGVAFGSPGIVENIAHTEHFFHITRNEDTVGTLYLDKHIGPSLLIEDLDFEGGLIEIGSSHNHWRYAEQVGEISASPLSPYLSFALPLLFLRDHENNDVTIGAFAGETIYGAVFGGEGSDTIRAAGYTALLAEGGNGTDYLWGGGGDDVLSGGGQNDTLRGQGGDDFLIGGSGGDTYHVALGEGYDIIDDRGGAGEDVLVLYIGEIASAFDPSWFTRAPDNPSDMLIRIPNGPGAWHVDIRIVGAVTSGGGIETIEIRSGAPEVVTASTSLTDIWLDLPQPAAPSTPTPTGPSFEIPTLVTLLGSEGRDSIVGSSGADVISGLGGFDWLVGGAGDDTLIGGSGGVWGPIPGTFQPLMPGDFLQGGDGDDLLIDDDPAQGLDADVLEGGAGDDVLVFHGAPPALITFPAGEQRGSGGTGYDRAIVDLRAHQTAFTATTTPGGSPVMFIRYEGFNVGQPLYLMECEEIAVWFGSGDDSAIGGSEIDYFYGGGGADQLNGGAGDDVLDGGAGDDLLTGGSGIDWLDGGSGIDRARLDLSDETRAVSFLAASAGRETGFTLVDGTHARNVELFDLYSGSGADRLTFSAGIAGQHSWAAGAGLDHLTIDQSTATTTVTFSVNSDGQFGFMTVAPIAAFGFVGEITFTQVDRFTITGGAADDHLNGGQLADELSGGRGDDRIIGNGGDDTLRGGAGDDILTGGSGHNWLDGGAGHDIATVSGVFSSYRLLRHGDDFILKGPDGGDRLTGIESIRFSDGRVLALNLMYGPDVDARAWADGRIPEALLSGGAWSEERPLVLPGPAGDDFLIAKDGGGPEVLPEVDDGDRWVWNNDDNPLVLPGAEDLFVPSTKGFDGPEVLPGVDDWTPAGGKGFDQPEVLPGPNDRVLISLDHAALFDRWSSQMWAVDEQGLVVNLYSRGGGESDGWNF